MTSATPGIARKRRDLQLGLVADHADDRAIRAAAQMGFQAERFDALDDVVDLLVGGI